MRSRPSNRPGTEAGAREVVVGIDFAGPARAAAQRRKILAVAATRTGDGAYEVAASGLNARLLESPPGWTAHDLAARLGGAGERVSVVAADFPFSLPAVLLDAPPFAALAGHAGAFRTWASFHAAVASALPLACPVDYRRFARWKDASLWARRACDVAAAAQPPLKHRFQVLFNMTLLGNAFLAALDRSGRFDAVPFQDRGRSPVVEVYPGHAMRSLGVRDYKRAPRRAIDAALAHLRSAGLSIAVDARIREVCETYDTGGPSTEDHDAADALVAACVAALYREGAARELAGDPALRGVEGTIWTVPGSPGGAAPGGERASAGRAAVSTRAPRARRRAPCRGTSSR